MTRRSDEGEELVPLPVVERPPSPAAPDEVQPNGIQPDEIGPDRIRPGEAARPGLDRRWRAVGLGVLLAVLVGAGVFAGAGGEADDNEADGASATTGPTVPRRAGDDEPAPEGWRRGSPGPLRHRDHAAQVWTGSELVVWAGDPDGDSGAAYDPAADRWRALAPAPIPARCRGASAWTGREVLVWGEACRLDPGPSDRPGGGPGGAAYDPAADRWRLLPPGPGVGGRSILSVWTGREWVLANPVGQAAAFDPATDRWRALPAVPRPFVTAIGHWTGRDVVVFGADEPRESGSGSGHWAAVLDVTAARWRILAYPPLNLAATAVWDGARLVAWDQNLRSFALDPADDRGWQPLEDLPLEFTDCSPQGAALGDIVFAEHCGRGALLPPGSSLWKKIPHPRSLAEPPVWTGREALFWVGSFAGSADGIWIYRP